MKIKGQYLHLFYLFLRNKWNPRELRIPIVKPYFRPRHQLERSYWNYQQDQKQLPYSQLFFFRRLRFYSCEHLWFRNLQSNMAHKYKHHTEYPTDRKIQSERRRCCCVCHTLPFPSHNKSRGSLFYPSRSSNLLQSKTQSTLVYWSTQLYIDTLFHRKKQVDRHYLIHLCFHATHSLWMV